MEWILIAGALCLSSHHDICVKQDGPYFRITGASKSMATTVMEDSIVVAEALARIRNEDAANVNVQDIQGSGRGTDKVVLGSGPYAAPPVIPSAGGTVSQPDTFRTTTLPSYTLPYTCYENDGPLEPKCNPVAIPVPPAFQTFPQGAMVESAPYGMTKEEFGRFIEDHVSRAHRFDSLFNGPMCEVSSTGIDGQWLVKMCPNK